jgi:putative DNA primase/helicase
MDLTGLFTVDSKSASDPKGNYIRSGWIDKDANGDRVYLFHSEGLKAATKGFSVAQVTKALNEAGWLAIRGKDGKGSVTRYIDGEYHRVYCIKPRLDG